jgi:hypothetical protein
MKPNRIVLALAFAGLAAPAFADKCHNCDFSDEPIVVTPKKSSGSSPSVSEIVVTKLTDSTSPALDGDRPLVRGTVPNTGEVARYNFTNGWPSKGGPERQPAPLPQSPMGGGHGAGKVNFSDVSMGGGLHPQTKAANVAPAAAGFRR